MMTADRYAMLGTIPQALTRDCPFCGGSGAKSASVNGICERCGGVGKVLAGTEVPAIDPIGYFAIHLRYAWRLFLAVFRLNLDAVCEMSKGLPVDKDFHDYPDSTIGFPWHLYTHTCKRCGKEFII